MSRSRRDEARERWRRRWRERWLAEHGGDPRHWHGHGPHDPHHGHGHGPWHGPWHGPDHPHDHDPRSAHPRRMGRHGMPIEVRKAWWRTRRGLQRRLFGAFGMAIALSITSVVLVAKWVGPQFQHRPSATIGATVLVFFLLWALSIAVSGFITFPIARLAAIVRLFGEGDLSVRARVHPRSPAEVRELGDAFDAMADRIETQVRGQRELLAAVSHELRTPLARLRLVLELGRERGANEATYRDAEGEIDAIDSLVGTLLAGARVDAGAMTPKRLDLVGLARDAVVRASERQTSRSYALETALESCMVSVDAALASRAIAVLLDNAEKHGGPNVVVRVTDDARLEVEDDGPGVPEAEREKIFEPFVRGAGKEHDETRGVGLGLHLVRRIADGHGTSAYVATAQPQGVIFGIGPFEKA